MSKVWFITGCSSGFGREIVHAALARGDKVVATARNPSKIEDLAKSGALTLALDVTSPDAEIEKVVAQALEHYGHIDILLNNAGMLLEGAIEETSDGEAKAQYNANFFGPLAVTRAVLPSMRARKSGVVAFMGSVGGWYGSVAVGVYCSTKWAIAAVADALADEEAHMGIHVTCIEPGYFRTDLLAGGSKATAKKEIEDLKPVVGQMKLVLASVNGKQPGDPVKGGKLIVEALTQSGRCEGRKLPKRLPIGVDCVEQVQGMIHRYQKELDEWKDVAVTTNCDDVK
jgi:NAD(P)-dependent dehydrogenase (short-subunit alcohol dehydrogenase family)